MSPIASSKDQASVSGKVPVILLVEDNPADVRLAQEVLREMGLAHVLYVARDGEQAMRMLRRQADSAHLQLPDLVLLDLNLPRKDGREVLKEMKSDPDLKRIPVLILSTSRADSDVLACYEHHANAYLTKPVDLDEFGKLASQLRDFWLTLVVLPPKPVEP